MNMKELLAGRAVIAIENEVNDEKNLIYQLVKEVLKASNNEIKFSSILSIGGDENHDSYELKCPDISYILKISLEKDCRELLNEANFHKKNITLECMPRYIDSGVLDIGDKISFLLLKKEQGVSLFDIDDDDCVFSEHFLYSWGYFSCCEVEKNFDQYFNECLKKHSLDNFDYLKNRLDPERVGEYEFLFSTIRDSVLKIYDKKDFEKGGTNHGNLNRKTIITNGEYFKFNDCTDCFQGSNLIDLCFLFLNLSFKQEDVDRFLDLCSLQFKVDKKYLLKDFHVTMPIVMHLKLLQLFYKMLIEYEIFSNERENICFETTSSFISVFYWCEKLNVMKNVVNPMESIIFELSSSPDECLHEIPDSINEPHKKELECQPKDKFSSRLSTPENLSLSYSKDGEFGSLSLSWDGIKSDNEYCILFQNPNLETSYYYTKNKNKYTIKDIDFIGSCLVAIKAISKGGTEDSEYNKSTFIIEPS